jgi:hypothetical protein
VKRWQAGAALLFLSILYTHFVGGEPSLGAWFGMYVLLMAPAAVGYAMSDGEHRGRPCALKDSGATHCDKLGA